MQTSQEEEHVKQELAPSAAPPSPSSMQQLSWTYSAKKEQNTEKYERKQVLTQGEVEQMDKSKLPHLLTKTVVGTAIPIFTHVKHLRHTVHQLNCKNHNKVPLNTELKQSTHTTQMTNKGDENLETMQNKEEHKCHHDNLKINDFARYDPVSMHIVVYVNTDPPKLSYKRERILEEWNRCTGLELHLQPPALQDYSYELDRKKTVVRYQTLLPVATLRLRHEVSDCWTNKRQMVTFVDHICIVPKSYAEVALGALLIKMEEVSMKVFHSTIIIICDDVNDTQYDLRRKVMQQNGYVQSKINKSPCNARAKSPSCIYYTKELNTLTSFASSHL